LQVELCDPCLSALRTRYLSSRALYKSTYLYLLLLLYRNFCQKIQAACSTIAIAKDDVDDEVLKDSQKHRPRLTITFNLKRAVGLTVNIIR